MNQKDEINTITSALLIWLMLILYSIDVKIYLP